MEGENIRSREFTFSLDEAGGLAESLKINDLKRLIAAMVVLHPFHEEGEYRLPYTALALAELEQYVSVRYDDENKCVVIKVHSQEMERNS